MVLASCWWPSWRRCLAADGSDAGVAVDVVVAAALDLEVVAYAFASAASGYWSRELASGLRGCNNGGVGGNNNNGADGGGGGGESQVDASVRLRPFSAASARTEVAWVALSALDFNIIAGRR